MDEKSNLTHWLHLLKEGDRGPAVEALWKAYFARLVGLARAHLANRRSGAADEEDVAISAFHSFCTAAANGRFPRLDDRDDMWKVLFVVTVRKAADLIEKETRAKRGGGRVLSMSAAKADDSAELPVAGSDPDPAEAAAVAEAVERLIGLLDDPQLRQIALWKLEGYTNEEIAEKIGRAVVSVERKLRRVRELWIGENSEG